MKKTFWLAPLALVAVSCSHHQPAQAPASAPVTEESALTGLPTYPRALPVTLTNAATATAPKLAAANAAPVPAMPAEPAETTTTSVPSSTPIETPPTTASEPAATTMTSTYTEPPSTPAHTESPVATATPPAAPIPPADTSAPTPMAPTTTTTSTYDLTTPSPAQVVVIDTTFGRMVIELDDFAAPKTCANFRKLVAAGFYNGTIFHRVIPGFIIQGGDPNTKGSDRTIYGKGDPGYTLPPEIKLNHDRGAVAMARLPDAVNRQRYSNGSQFYICLAACPSLDGQYTVFGHVIAGLDVADRIGAAPADPRNDPLERIDMKASFEPRDRALRDNAPTGP